MKIDFFSHLAERNLVKYAVKRNNTFMAVKTEKLKFLDISNYLARGFSYSQYLKAYKCTEQKGFFPYEWMTSLDKLIVSQLPPHEAFFSTLKNDNISANDYQLCQRVWEDNDMKTMKEYLVWYNNKDVVPMLDAIKKMLRFYTNRHIDMFKDGISVPRLTLKYMFQDLRPMQEQHRWGPESRLPSVSRERPYLHTTQGIRRSQTMQVYHRLRRQCTLFMVNHAGHADRTFRSPKRRNRLPAGNTQKV